MTPTLLSGTIRDISGDGEETKPEITYQQFPLTLALALGPMGDLLSQALFAAPHPVCLRSDADFSESFGLHLGQGQKSLCSPLGDPPPTLARVILELSKD